MKYFKIVLSILFIFTFLTITSQKGFSAGQDVYIISISDAISPGVSDFLINGIEKASDQQAALTIIELNTPGGLVDSMREIVIAIYKSRVPVVVYVSPSGARAASAGVMITMAADIAAMAPGTNIGAAHPVGAGGKEINKTMNEKVLNDMVAYVKSIAQKRDRNAKWAERAVRESVSATETEALNNNIIDLIAADTDDLIDQLNGWEVKEKGKLDLEHVNKVILKEGLRTKVLKTISNPNIAYILMMIGLAGLYFEFSNPGAIFPGVVGGIALILAFFSFQTLPVNYAGILLIVLAVIFFIMELKIASYGLLSVAGVVSLFLGSLMLFEKEGPEFQLAWQVLIPTIVVVSGFFIAIAGLVFKSQVKIAKTGTKGLVGEIGVVKKRLAPEGKVFVHGELWNAVSSERIDVGEKVRVTRVENLILEVETIRSTV